MRSFITPLFATLASTVIADFRIGNCASSELDNADATGIALPGSQVDCNYKAVPENSDICSAQEEIRTLSNGGVCPGNNDDRSLSFCGIDLPGSGCPASFQMDARDDCGDVALRREALAEDGFFYAGLIDTAKNNAPVGRCVYEVAQNGTQKCSAAGAEGEDAECATFIKCYTTMYGTTEC